MSVISLDCTDPENVERELVKRGSHPYIRALLEYNKTDVLGDIARLRAVELRRVLVTAGYLSLDESKIRKIADEYVWRIAGNALAFERTFEMKKVGAIVKYRVRDRYTELARAFPDDYTELELHVRFLPATVARYANACYCGNLRLVQYFDRIGRPVGPGAFVMAICSGNLELIAWLHARGAELNYIATETVQRNDISYAVWHRHPAVMDLLMTYGPYVVDYKLLELAARRDYLDGVKWICARGVRPTQDLYIYTTDLGIIKWLHGQLQTAPPNYALYGIKNLETFVYLHTAGCTITESAIRDAVQNKHLDIIKYIYMVAPDAARDPENLIKALADEPLFHCLMSCGYRPTMMKIGPGDKWYNQIDVIYYVREFNICQYLGAYYLTRHELIRIIVKYHL